MNKGAEQDPRVYFAAERTFLAWIRTGLGLIGVVFAVAPFGLFLRGVLRERTRMRVYFAAERTVLAWIRTGLGLMGVGFAVARFGLFLREMQSDQTHMPVDSWI